jgi:hypothetical protein
MEDQQEAAMMDGVEKEEEEEEEEEEDLEIIIVEMEKILVTGKQTSGTSQSFLNHVSSCSSFSDCGIHHGATFLPSSSTENFELFCLPPFSATRMHQLFSLQPGYYIAPELMQHERSSHCGCCGVRIIRGESWRWITGMGVVLMMSSSSLLSTKACNAFVLQETASCRSTRQTYAGEVAVRYAQVRRRSHLEP